MQDKSIQLFIFPYAGGSIASFKRLTDLIDRRIEVVTIEYPGRGTRAKEPLAGDLKEMLDDAVEYCRVRRDADVPFAVMGYSMGCLLGYEMLVKNLLSGDLIHFFLAAEVSPQTRALELRQEEDPSEERVLERAKELGGLDVRMLGSKRFREIYLRPMISDYMHFFEYRYLDHKRKIRSDATIFFCEKDTARKDVREWEHLIDGCFDYHEIGNDHFFINQHYKEMADVINERLLGKMGIMI